MKPLSPSLYLEAPKPCGKICGTTLAICVTAVSLYCFIDIIKQPQVTGGATPLVSGHVKVFPHKIPYVLVMTSYLLRVKTEMVMVDVLLSRRHILYFECVQRRGRRKGEQWKGPERAIYRGKAISQQGS